MPIRRSKLLVRILSAVSILFGLFFTQSAMASEHETACKDHIQNKIAWDSNSPYERSSKWEQANLERLCKGTKNPKEPGECFHKVMTGHVKWGASDKWEWKNAIGLCAGTDNSDERISCFKGRIETGEKWDAAILQCQSSGKIVIR
ncbi:hypothetical protein [Methyloglobulus sp.]|uniref:hypothetical protein n=1 Tax=Methyloglobulus sp. TaxID=2518622 RepID=UPI003989C05A